MHLTRVLRITLCALLLLPVPGRAAPDRLPPQVQRELDIAGLPSSAISILVQGVDETRPRLAVHAGQPMAPASLMKLLTTYAALDLLGPGYVWKTEAFIDSALSDDILPGDLFLKGSGDPRLTQEQFWLLLRQLRARGLRDIRGDLVIDRSVFDVRAEDSQPFDDQPLRPYNVGPDALLLNFKALRFTLVPRPARGSVDVVPEYRPDSLDVVNLVRLGTGDCGDWKEGLHAEQVKVDSGFRLTLTGTYPAACGERDWMLGVLPGDDYIGSMFRDQWRLLGGRFEGRVRSGTVPFNATRVASIESPPLGQVVRDINKYSNNVMARQLYLTLGMEAGRKPARPADAEAVIRTWLAVKGLHFPELVLENGSGLSHAERISADSLGKLLRSVWTSPIMPELLASLPVVAIDGTMKNRLAESHVRGQAHIKTGTLDGVKAIAGFVRSRSGKYFIVACIINHPGAAAAQVAQDTLLKWVFLLPDRT